MAQPCAVSAVYGGSSEREFKHNSKAIENYEAAILKTYHLNLDNIQEDLLPLFSLTGRPSNQQPELFRSFILISHFKYDGIDQWVENASASPLLCALVGVKMGEFSGASTHRGFQERLWMADKPSRTRKSSATPKGKYGKNKLPLRHQGIVAYMVVKALSGEVFKRIPKRLLQTIFMKTAVIPSAKAGLLGDINKMKISADGTWVKSHAFPKVIKPVTAKYAAIALHLCRPASQMGLYSYHEQWFYGYTAYLLSVHNSVIKLDLPIYLEFVDASRNDIVSLIVAPAHARYLYKDILSFDSFPADAAHGNYPTYYLLKQ